MSKFSRNLVVAFAVCSTTAFLYLPSLLGQEASKKSSSVSVKAADGTRSVPAAATVDKVQSKKTKATSAAQGQTTAPDRAGSSKAANAPSANSTSGNAASTKSTSPGTASTKATATSTAAKAVAKSPAGNNDGGAEKSKAATGKLRLPRYFSGIVDEDQREQCLAIQLEYRQKVAELEEELSRVRQDEMTALEKVLTDSQRKLLDKKRSESKSKAPVELNKTASESEDGGM